MPKDAHGDGVIATLSVALDRSSAEPLVRQLINRLRELILSGRIGAGAKLPSTRRLAHDLGVSRTVTADAFGQLSAEGFIEAHHGAGHFVARLPIAAEARLGTFETALPRQAEVSIWTARGMPFDPSWLGVDLFPAQTWSRMVGRGWRKHHAQSLERHWRGLPVLREVLAAHLHALRGLLLSPDQLMITSGHADALALIGRAVRTRNGRSVKAWVEDPGLLSARMALQREGIETVPVPVDPEGLMISAGEDLASDAAIALVTSTRQFPLGMPLSLPRRLELLEWSRRVGATIIDDDYDAEIRFAGRPLQSLATLDSSARVLTLGSFSKLTFPGIRLGYVAGPRDVIAELEEMRRQANVLVPTGDQAGLAEFIATGSFARHLRNLRHHLTSRRQAVVSALEVETDGLVEVLPQQAGMHLTVRLAPRLRERVTDVALAERASSVGLVLLPLSKQYSRGTPQHGFMLGYAGWDETQIRASASNFGKLLRDAETAQSGSS